MKYLALDIGNVLCRVSFDPLLNKISSYINISTDEAKTFLQRMQKMHDLGLTTIDDELQDKLKIRSESVRKEIIDLWESCVTAEPLMIGKIDKWVDKYDLKIALLSNIGPEHAKAMPQIMKRAEFYNDTIKYFSCEVGVRKPSTLYYQSFLMQYPEFKGCLYIDDLSENLDASRKFGFKTYQFSLETTQYSFDFIAIEEIIKGL